MCQSKNCYKDDYKVLFGHMGLARSGGPPPPIRPSAKPPDDSGSPDELPEPGPLPSGGPWHAPFYYHDVAGTPVLAVVRKDTGPKNAETGKTPKTFLQFTPTDNPDLWVPKGIEQDRPLFHLPKIVQESA